MLASQAGGTCKKDVLGRQVHNVRFSADIHQLNRRLAEACLRWQSGWAIKGRPSAAAQLIAAQLIAAQLTAAQLIARQRVV